MNKFEIIKPFIAPLIIFTTYKLIGYLATKINLSQYSFKGVNESANPVSVTWFNSDVTNTNMYYRFKVNDVLVFINRNEITFYHKLKLIIWFFCEVCKIKTNKYYRVEDRKLPKFVLSSYVFPKETEINNNLKLK